MVLFKRLIPRHIILLWAKQTDKHSNRHYWKQYHPHCVGGGNSDNNVSCIL